MVLIVSVATSLIWIKILKSFDDAQGLKSKRTAVSGFFLYGLLSGPLVLLLYAVAGPLAYPITRGSAVLENLFLVGPVEELGKFLIFYLVAVGSGSIQEPRDGVLHAALVGLAFAVVENVFYSVYGLELLLYRLMRAAAATAASRGSAAEGAVPLKPGGIGELCRRSGLRAFAGGECSGHGGPATRSVQQLSRPGGPWCGAATGCRDCSAGTSRAVAPEETLSLRRISIFGVPLGYSPVEGGPAAQSG